MKATMTLLCLTTGLMIGAGEVRGEKADAPPQSPELKVLDRFVGTWDTEMTALKPREIRTTGATTIAWALGGRFVQFQGSTKPGKLQDLQLLTYDPARKAYRHWYFSSEGVADESTGQWNEETQTMTWKGTVADGNALVNKVHFSDQNTMEWKLVVTDKAGKVQVDLEGKLTRRK